MRRRIYLFLLLTSACVLLSPTVFSASFDDYLVFSLFFIAYSALAWWFATVLLIFGMTFLQGFILGYVVWAASFFVADEYRKILREKEQKPASQEVPGEVRSDPLRFMKLS